MGSDESHFNVSVGSDGQSHKTVSTNDNLSEEKGEPKQYRTGVNQNSRKHWTGKQQLKKKKKKKVFFFSPLLISFFIVFNRLTVV